MADDPSPFEIYTKEFELRLKLIETMGKWNKEMAEAEVQWATARLTHARAATVEKINRELQIAMLELKREERRAKDRISRAENDAQKTKMLMTARKPASAISFSQAWNGFDWFLGESDSEAVLAAIELPADITHRARTNFVAILVTKPEVVDAPDEYNNFGLLKGWMQSNYFFFKSGSPVHSLTIKAMKAIQNSRTAVLADLRARLAETRDQSYEKMSELRAFLGLPAAAEKTPSVPKTGSPGT
ncbi:hypothetical protein NA78x_002789 [Anatilimnocola sp. NA78]|uniref:hypothetical protein n=1 Tax=Anatilimnocola sp. NA78 TaxID=3415683 RepID=UPI003CE488B3